MGLLLCAVVVIALVAIEWYLRAVLVTPMPKCADTVFYLDEESKAELEYAVRGYRFLKKYGYIQGKFVIVLRAPSEEGRKMAQIFAHQEDIMLIEKDGGVFCPE